MRLRYSIFNLRLRLLAVGTLMIAAAEAASPAIGTPPAAEEPPESIEFATTPSVRENRLANVGVADFEDNRGNDVLYELVSGEGDDDNEAFIVKRKENNSQLQTNQTFDYEFRNAYSIRVRATIDGESIEQAFTVAVTNVEEPPTEITLSPSSVDQEAPEGTTVGTLSSSGGAPVPVSYSLVSGSGDNDNDAFKIESDQLLTNINLEEARESYSIRVQASGDGTFSTQLTVTVNPSANQAPVANAGPDQTIVDEDRDGEATVTLNGSGSSDEDGGIVSYTWKENSATGSTLVEGVQPTIAVPTGDNLIALVVEDNDGETASDVVMIYIDTPPTAEAGDSQTVTDEDGNGSENITLDGSASTDSDGEIVSYQWIWNEGSVTVTDPQTNVSLPIGENQVTLTVTDNEGLTHSDNTTVVVNAPAAPGGINLSNTSVFENRDAGELVGTLDVDASLVVYSLPAGELDNQFFRVETRNGSPTNNSLVTDAVFDFETKNTYQVRVRAVYGIFRSSIEETFTITVTNENEDPVANAGPDQTVVDENRDGVASVTLDGSGSSDVDNNIASYAWSWSGGGSASGVNPQAILPVGNTTITLTVTDDEGLTDTDQVVITVNEGENQAPVASAGPDQTVTDDDGNGSQTVTLNGSASTDDLGISSYVWTEGSTEIATGAQPDVNLTVGVHTIVLTVTDADGASDTDQVTITVNEQPNQAPTANAGPDQTITDENGDNAADVTLNGSGSSDEDGSIASYAWSWSGGGSASGVNPQVTLPIGNTTITLTVTDDGGKTDTDQVRITVNEPEDPVIELSNSEVAENEETGTVVGILSTESAIALTYSLPNALDNGSFRIVSGNQLVTDEVFDREAKASYTVRVRATYPIGSVEQDFTITIANVSESPTGITLTNRTIGENQANATVGTLETTGGQGPFTYTLTGNNNDNGLFTIDGDQLKTQGALDFETKASLRVTVTSTNDGSVTETFTVAVTNVAEPPTDIVISSSSVNENESSGTLVGTLSATGGASVPISYQFVGSGNDNSSFRLNGNQLLTNEVFDREEKPSYSIRIQAEGDGTFAKSFTINIANVNDAPTISVTNDRIIFEEGSEPIKILSDITVSDVDSPVLNGATLTFANNYVSGEDELVGGNWNASEGVLTIVGPISVSDLQAALRNVTYKNNQTINPTSSAREIRITVNDGALDSNNERVFVLVDNPNIPPSIVDFEVQTPEDQPYAFTAEVFEGNYEDMDDEFPNQIYIESAPVNGVLTVDGRVITNATIVANRPRGVLVDFSANENFVYTPLDDFNGSDEFRWNVYDDDNSGNGAMVTVTVNPVNDAPVISAPIQFSTQESEPLALSGVTYEDVDNDILRLTLSVSEGFLLVGSGISEDVSILEEEESGVKRLQIEASANDLTSIMGGISYVARDNPSERDELQIELTDTPSNSSGAFSDQATVTILITPNNDPPILANLEETALTYTENNEPILITETLEITDEEDDTILAATLTITSGVEGDELIFNSTADITADFGNNELLLQGEATLDDYQAAIRTVSFVSYSNNPGTALRQIQIQVTDVNNGKSNIVARSLEVIPVDDSTQITQIAEEGYYIIGNVQTTLFGDGLISDPDDETLTSLVVRFEDGSFSPGVDFLGLESSAGLSVTWDEAEGVLTISGEADLPTYQSLLQAVSYQHTGEDETTKVLSITTTTPSGASSTVTQLVRVVNNQPPVLSNLELAISSSDTYLFTADLFQGAYSDPDNFPTESGLAAIRIVTLPQTGQLRLNQEPVTEEQLGVNGLLIRQENISQLSYVQTSNEAATDAFTWNATDGAEFAEQNATVTFAIQILSVSLGEDITEVCNGNSTMLTATVEGGIAPLIYEWTCDLPECNISGGGAEVSVAPEESGTYQVTVTDANGTQANYTVLINVTDCDLVIPSGFTPNGDNINDTWQLENISTFDKKVVVVYDRFGHQVFYSDDYATPWRGEYKGKMLPVGTYYYRIELDSGAQRYQGKVTILQ